MSAPVLTRVVRTLGSDRTHVASLHPDQLGSYRVFGAEFTGATLPVATRCGVVLRSSQGVAVCMAAGQKVRCSRCVRLTGLAVAADDNTDIGAPQ